MSLGIVGHKRHICVTGVRKKKKKRKENEIARYFFLSIIVLAALVAKNNNDDNNKYIRFLVRQQRRFVLSTDYSHTIL